MVHPFFLGVAQEMLLLSTGTPTLFQLRCKNKRGRKGKEIFVRGHHQAALAP